MPFRWSLLFWYGPVTRPKVIGAEHVAIQLDDLAAMLPNRGVAMVYWH